MLTAPVPLLAQTAPAARSAARGQGQVSVSGYLRDTATGEALIGATISVPDLGLGTTADEHGFYALMLPPGTYTLVYSYLGYMLQKVPLTLVASVTQSVRLVRQGVQTDEVVVTARQPDQNVQRVETGVSSLDAKTIKLLPALVGEVDVVRSLLLLPGVSTVGEGAPGFNVRGGGIDQNLILLDEAPVYNASHLFGLFSSFNADAVQDLKLVRGGIPAQYGGRLSSLLDVRMKEGSMQRVGVSGAVGLVSSRLAVEGPLVKDKASFLVAGRYAYGFPVDQGGLANFYDVSAKLTYVLGARDRLLATGYFGRDALAFGQA